MSLTNLIFSEALIILQVPSRTEYLAAHLVGQKSSAPPFDLLMREHHGNIVFVFVAEAGRQSAASPFPLLHFRSVSRV